MDRELTEERPAFLSTLSATHADRRRAGIVVLLSALVFVALAPFAKTPLAPIWAFIPIYQAALVVNDLITAVLLFGQFRILRTHALLLLAGGYVYTAFIAIAHTLSFPGLFTPTGLLGAGPQTTAWLYLFWHGGFPLVVIAYALLKRGETRVQVRPGLAVAASLLLVAAVVAGFTLLAGTGGSLLPAVMQGSGYTPAMIVVVSTVWCLSLLALAVLGWRRPHSVLDLWLMVVMCAWLFDIALAAVLNGGRFDLGFYAGRIYGLLAASFVLLMLLLENGALYAKLVDTHEREHRRALELAALNRELESFSYSVSHDLRAPLRAMDGYAQILDEDYAGRLDAPARGYLERIRAGSRRMGQLIDDLLAFSRLGRQPVATRPVQLDDLVQQVVQELRTDCADRQVRFEIQALGTVQADPTLLKQALVNLIGNAIKFTRDQPQALIEIGRRANPDGRVYYVKDNGAGFDMQYADKLFTVFQRFHSAAEYPGTGVGLAIVQRVIQRHGGRIWADAAPQLGATFYFTLP